MRNSISISAVIIFLGALLFSSCNFLSAVKQASDAMNQQQQMQNGNIAPEQMNGFAGMQNPGNAYNSIPQAEAYDYDDYEQATQMYQANPPAYSNYYGSTGYSANTNAQYDYINSSYENQQRAYEAAFEKWDDYVLGYQNYNDADGNSYKLYSGYDNNYYNSTTGEYLQTNDASYDPNQYSTSSWGSLTPSDYSSSSYSSSSYPSYGSDE